MCRSQARAKKEGWWWSVDIATVKEYTNEIQCGETIKEVLGRRSDKKGPRPPTGESKLGLKISDRTHNNSNRNRKEHGKTRRHGRKEALGSAVDTLKVGTRTV